MIPDKMVETARKEWFEQIRTNRTIDECMRNTLDAAGVVNLIYALRLCIFVFGSMEPHEDEWDAIKACRAALERIGDKP